MVIGFFGPDNHTTVKKKKKPLGFIDTSVPVNVPICQLTVNRQPFILAKIMCVTKVAEQL